MDDAGERWMLYRNRHKSGTYAVWLYRLYTIIPELLYHRTICIKNRIKFLCFFIGNVVVDFSAAYYNVK